jgi:hypothetical protein
MKAAEQRKRLRLLKGQSFNWKVRQGGSEATHVGPRRRFGNKRQSSIFIKKIQAASYTYAWTLLEYRMIRKYKTRYFAPDIQIREQQLPIQKNENNQLKKQARLLIRNASDCDSMNDFVEIPQRHHPGNHLGQKGWVSRYYA